MADQNITDDINVLLFINVLSQEMSNLVLSIELAQNSSARVI